MIELNDRGLTLGDGLFETLLAIDGQARHVQAHFDRLTAGCATLGLPGPGLLQVRDAINNALASADLTKGRAAVRLSLTAGPGGRGLERPDLPHPVLFAVAAPAPPWTTPARLVVVAPRRNEGSPASRLKTLSYIDTVLARREALARGADEAVMLNNAGHVACAAAGNLFWRDGEALCTPSLDCGVLAGTARARLIAAARASGMIVREGRFVLEDLRRASEIQVTNALIEVRPALFVD